jgi:signal peptidase I
MTERTLNPDPSFPAAQSPSKSRWKRATLAGLLSFLFPGMGQLFNRQPRKALILAVISHLFGAIQAHTRLLLSFHTMVATILFLLVWKAVIAAEAAYGAAKEPEAPVPQPWLTYSIFAVLIFVGAIFPSPDQLKRGPGFSAFKIPSKSMCPTICVGDRVVADLHAYRSNPPQRGDIVLLKHESMEALMVKRVIAVAGDVVEPGPSGTIIVNGQPFRPPTNCPNPTWQKEQSDNDPRFQSTKVPEGTLFVVGDNLPNSFDSRLPEFGKVTPEMVRGKLLFLYWSPIHSRIGCSLH